MAKKATTLVIFDDRVPDDYTYVCDDCLSDVGETVYVGPADIAHPCCYCNVVSVDEGRDVMNDAEKKRFRRLGFFLMLRDEYATKYGTPRPQLTHHALTMIEIRERNPFARRRIRRLLQKVEG